MAHRRRRGQPGHGTLNTTALVHEVFLRLRKGNPEINDRQHFMRLAGRVMRQILVSHARRRCAEKRGGGLARVPIDELVDAYNDSAVDIIALEDALDRLKQSRPELVVLVELRFYAGVEFLEIAEMLDVSERTVRRQWKAVRTLMRSMMQ